MKKFKALFILFCFTLTVGFGQESSPGLKVAFWNVENLFDLVDDPDINDDEFAEGGKKQFTWETLDLKLDRLSEVMEDLDADVLGLCEVENRGVVDMLNERYLGCDYAIVHYDSPDERGIDVVLLYDSTRFRVTQSQPLPVKLPEDEKTRDVLYVQGRYGDQDLHLFVNHWPSKYGGAERTIPFRAEAARTVRRAVDRILEADPEAEILIMGDLNDDPVEPSIQEHLGATLDPALLGSEGKILLNLMAPFYKKENGGSYKYRGQDMVIDHIIVSPGLMDGKGLTVVSGSMGILDNDRYRQASGDFAGYPFRFWAGDRVLGGYSDHLAIQVRITTQGLKKVKSEK